MKRLLNIAMAMTMLAAIMVGCCKDEVWVHVDPKNAAESTSSVKLSMNLSIPDAVKVGSRNFEGVDGITVVCFDEEHKSLGSVPVEDANLTATGDESGYFSVMIPNKTRILHVIANQDVELDKGKSESELETLVADPNKMIYWARIEVPNTVKTSAEMKDWANNGTKYIRLLRNMAKILVTCDTEDFVLSGYTVVNTNKNGYVAPYNAEDGVFPTDTIGDYTPAFTLEDWSDGSYVHANGSELISSNGILKDSVYVYETLSDSKPCIIIKGRNATDAEDVVKYWRVSFSIDGENMLNIRRNHRYQVAIEGSLLYGESTFEAALNSETTANNAWLSIDDEVTAIKNKEFSLTLEQTSYVLFDGTTSHSFTFNIEQLGSTPFNANDLTVKWEDGDYVCALDKSNGNGFEYEYAFDDENPKLVTGTVKLSLAGLGEGINRRDGKVIIQYGNNLLRRVKIEIIPLQTFGVDSYNLVDGDNYVEQKGDTLVYKISNNRSDYPAGEYIINGSPIDKLRFTLPTDFPTSLFPFNVLVSTTDFNVVNAPLIFEGAGGYGTPNNIGYKYVFPVSAAIDSNDESIVYEIPLKFVKNEIPDKVFVKLEADYFESLVLEIHYYLGSND